MELKSLIGRHPLIEIYYFLFCLFSAGGAGSLGSLGSLGGKYT